MEYKISTKDAKSLKKSIIDCVKNGEDTEDKNILTWGVEKTDKKEEVLVHTTDQWEEKCCLHLEPNKDNDILKVRFSYWSSFKKEERSGDEDRYIFGRFTELALVHFYSEIAGISLEK